MRRLATICNLLILALLLLMGGCRQQAAGTEEAAVVDEDRELSRGFDPLELSVDKRIVPLASPKSGVVNGRTSFVESDPDQTEADSMQTPIRRVPDAADTLNSQAYRVQIATSKLYGEAQRSVAVAEEIFDRPVFVDYEVPYFKVRVGSFATRDDAEAYSQKAKAAGYSNAWVIMVTIDKKEPPGLYPDVPEYRYLADSSLSDSLIREYKNNEADSL